MQMAAESSYKRGDHVMIAAAIVLVLVYEEYEEEHSLTLNAYRRRVLVACTNTKYPIMLIHRAFSSLVGVMFYEEHNDLFISFSLS